MMLPAVLRRCDGFLDSFLSEFLVSLSLFVFCVPSLSLSFFVSKVREHPRCFPFVALFKHCRLLVFFRVCKDDPHRTPPFLSFAGSLFPRPFSTFLAFLPYRRVGAVLLVAPFPPFRPSTSAFGPFLLVLALNSAAATRSLRPLLFRIDRLDLFFPPFLSFSPFFVFWLSVFLKKVGWWFRTSLQVQS